MINEIFELSHAIRYVATYANGQLEQRSRRGIENASSSESDKYEELLVNPTLLKLATQRANIDCGGLDCIVVGYGNFYQVVVPTSKGHVSVCVEKSADPIAVGNKVMALVKEKHA